MYDSGFDFAANDAAMSRFLEATDRAIAAIKAAIAANTAHMNRPRLTGPIVLSNRDCDALFGAPK